jgi:histidinol-phosphate aminotransferase
MPQPSMNDSAATGDPVSATDLPIRADLRGLTPYGAPQLTVPARLNVNENPYAPSAALARAVGDAVAAAMLDMNRYPDREAADLRTDLARYLDPDGSLGLDASGVWAANGSNEVMLHVMQAFGGPGRRALTFTPTYSMYPDYCRDTFTEFHTVARRDDFTIDVDQAIAAVRSVEPAVVLLASPNNPTGTALPMETIEAIHDAVAGDGAGGTGGGMVVVDEAYAEFRRPGTPTALSLLKGRPRLIVTRTMSKAFGLAGARLGYAAAAPEVVDALRLVRLPYHLSAVTQAVARVALAHAEQLMAQVDALRLERDALVVWLREQGWQVADSDANFVLFGRFRDRHAVWQRLLEQGVLIRETGPDGWLRVSVGTPEEMGCFRHAMEHVTTNGDRA